MGRFYTDLTIDGDRFHTLFHIVEDKILPVDIILGKELLSQTITTLSPNNITMKKFIPENYSIVVEHDNGFPEMSNITDKKLEATIKNMIVNYSPKTRRQDSDIEMKIILKHERPIYQRPRRLSPLETEIVRKQIDEWIAEGIVRSSKSEYASPIVLANKKDGTKRLCVDFRKLNEAIVKDRYPLPLIKDQIDLLQGAKIFSTLDLRNGFFHVPVAIDSVKYTAFITPFGHYEFLRAPFGLCNSPSVFQRFINNIFKQLVSEKKLCVYMDDLVVPAKDEKEALSKLAAVLKVAEENGLQIKWEKCQFLSKSIQYLGYEIDDGQVKPSNRKKTAITKFPEPKNTTKVQSFLGLTGYFRKFVKNYAVIAKPLSDLLRKDSRFVFGAVQKEAFEQLKGILTSELKIYSPTAEKKLHTDACKIGLGAILLQKGEGDENWYPVFYYSKKTSPCEEKYNSYELEVLAIVSALKKFRVYLLGLNFKIVTDCAAFKATMKKKELTSRIAGWALQLQEFSYALEHRASHRMRHVDALSRSPVILTIEEDVSNKVKAAQRDDDRLKPIFKLLESGQYDEYVSNNGVLFKSVKGALVLVVPEAMQSDVIRTYHEQGHFAVRKTQELIERQYYIPKLVDKIKIAMKHCIPCLLSERKKGKQEGLLNPIPKGDTPLVTYHIDHLGHLTTTRKQYKYILCVIDAFSKFVWLYPCKSTTSKEVIRKLDIQKAVFGNPLHILSDKGTAFTSSEFRDYCQSEGIEHSTITTGMPTGNDQVERINRIIIPALSKMAIDKPEEWYKFTDKLQRFLNNTYQRSIAMSPFELLVGIKMRCPEDIRLKEIIEQETALIHNEDRQNLREAARWKIMEVQEENKRNFNQRRKVARVFRVGDLVLIKRTQFGTMKLLRKFLGPYQIVKVKERDRYDVQKIGQSEGPNKTSTCAEYMKPYYDGVSEDESEDELDQNPSASNVEDLRSSETDD